MFLHLIESRHSCDSQLWGRNFISKIEPVGIQGINNKGHTSKFVSTRNLILFIRETRFVLCDKNFICVLTGSRFGCYSESSTSSRQMTQTEPSWILVILKRDELT